MRKLKLSLDALAVQSFDTAPVVRGLGTVQGQQDRIALPGGATHPDCPSPLCVDTPLASCDGTCGAPGCNAYPIDAADAAEADDAA